MDFGLGVVMRSYRTRLRDQVLLGVSLLVLAGCLGPAVKTQPVVSMPQTQPPIVKQYKTVTVPANQAGLVDTGVDLTVGEAYTLLATGVVDLYPRIGSRKTPEEGVRAARSRQGAHRDRWPRPAKRWSKWRRPPSRRLS